jgi:hypothetical protein
VKQNIGFGQVIELMRASDRRAKELRRREEKTEESMIPCFLSLP